MNTLYLLKISQLVISLLLILAILLQSKGVGLSSVITTGAWLYRSRRGLERALFSLTIILAVLFLVFSFLIFYFSRV